MTIPNEIAGTKSNDKNKSIVSRLIDHGAENILVVGQYNLGLTPGMNFVPGNARLLGDLTQQFNSAVQRRVERQQRTHPKLHIAFVDLETPINEAEGTIYSQLTIGERCESYNNNSSLLDNGLFVPCSQEMIGWWNTSHLANALNQVVADSILHQAKKMMKS